MSRNEENGNGNGNGKNGLFRAMLSWSLVSLCSLSIGFGSSQLSLSREVQRNSTTIMHVEEEIKQERLLRQEAMTQEIKLRQEQYEIEVKLRHESDSSLRDEIDRQITNSTKRIDKIADLLTELVRQNTDMLLKLDNFGVKK